MWGSKLNFLLSWYPNWRFVSYDKFIRLSHTLYVDNLEKQMLPNVKRKQSSLCLLFPYDSLCLLGTVNLCLGTILNEFIHPPASTYLIWWLLPLIKFTIIHWAPYHVRHCARSWEYNGEQADTVPDLMELIVYWKNRH